MVWKVIWKNLKEKGKERKEGSCNRWIFLSMKFFARRVFLLINFFTRALQHFSFGFVVVVVVFFYRYCVNFFLKTFSFFLFLFYCSSNVLKQLMERLNVLRETICCSFDGWNFQNSERNGSVWRERWTRSRTVVIYLLEFPLEFFEEFYILHIFEFIHLFDY